MNYRHAFHAGNLADVVKHLALVALLGHLRRKDKPFCVIDTHAGAGLYDLAGDSATRTGESAEGIARLARLVDRPGLPASLETYLTDVRDFGVARYPGSPVIAAKRLRPQDRLIAIERHPEEFALLQAALGPFAKARAVAADGYARLPALLPPPERRGLIVIDPPFEAEDEFARVVSCLSGARRRFATGVYLVWFPVKSMAAADALAGEVAVMGAEPVLRILVDVGPGEAAERLHAAGLLVINPPFGFAEEMAECAKVLAPVLGRGGDARFAIGLLGDKR